MKDVQPFVLRKRPDPAKIAARVKRLAREAEPVEGVQPLNPGFFALERMRSATVPKKRAAVRGKLRDK